MLFNTTSLGNRSLPCRVGRALSLLCVGGAVLPWRVVGAGGVRAASQGTGGGGQAGTRRHATPGEGRPATHKRPLPAGPCPPGCALLAAPLALLLPSCVCLCGQACLARCRARGGEEAHPPSTATQLSTQEAGARHAAAGSPQGRQAKGQQQPAPHTHQPQPPPSRHHNTQDSFRVGGWC